jgi:hypothetical protein
MFGLIFFFVLVCERKSHYYSFVLWNRTVSTFNPTEQSQWCCPCDPCEWTPPPLNFTFLSQIFNLILYYIQMCVEPMELRSLGCIQRCWWKYFWKRSSGYEMCDNSIFICPSSVSFFIWLHSIIITSDVLFRIDFEDLSLCRLKSKGTKLCRTVHISCVPGLTINQNYSFLSIIIKI